MDAAEEEEPSEKTAATAWDAISRTARCGASPLRASGGPVWLTHERIAPLWRDMARRNRESPRSQMYLMARSALSLTMGERWSTRRARCSALSSTWSVGIERIAETSSSRRYTARDSGEGLVSRDGGTARVAVGVRAGIEGIHNRAHLGQPCPRPCTRRRACVCGRTHPSWRRVRTPPGRPLFRGRREIPTWRSRPPRVGEWRFCQREADVTCPTTRQG